MNLTSRKFLSVLAGCALLGGLTAQAQDKTTLDLLVSKGVITQAEADAAAKQAAIVAKPKEKSVQSLTITGRLHIQYDWINTEDKGVGAANPPATNEFFIRRAYLGAIVDMGNGWGGELIMDFAAGAGAGPVGGSRNLFDKAIISKKMGDYGTGIAGYQKVQFVLEENTSSSAIKAVERSIATRFFNEDWGGSTTGRLGFGNRHVGLYWNGVIPSISGFTYGVALVNGVQSSTSFASGLNPSFNQLGMWGNVGYSGTLGQVAYKTGVNLGYSMDGNSGVVGGVSQNNTMFGYNPYVTLTWGDLEVTAEFIQAQVQNGRIGGGVGATSSDAWPYGFNITPSYKFTPEWEAVLRFSYISTNGRGATVNNLMRNAPNVVTGGTSFDEAYAIYAGFNWYIVGNSVKLSAGYEFAQFEGRVAFAGSPRFDGPNANVSAFRTRLQLLF